MEPGRGSAAMGGIQGYQAGSTFKLFTLAAALEKGIPISKRFNARSPMSFTSAATPPAVAGSASGTAGWSRTPSGIARPSG